MTEEEFIKEDRWFIASHYFGMNVAMNKKDTKALRLF
jgi:hypothetical protein